MPSPTHDRARELVLAFGWNTTAYQILNPGIQFWFSAQGDAVVGYVPAGTRWVVAGAPVCAPERLASVAEELEHDARRSGRRIVYFGAEGRLDALYGNGQRHARLLLGSQPMWRPAAWHGRVHSRASMRAQLYRARNKGVEVEHWPSARAEDDPRLRRCLEEWLATRPLPPLHFLVEPETLGTLHDRSVFVAIRDGTPVGFLVASPIPARNGWLTEQFVRGINAPNGTAELLIDAAVDWMAEHDASYVTLGLAPLSERAIATSTPAWHDAPFWLRALLRWTRAHGRRFYHFEGLDAFKAKFAPEKWEPVYAIADEPVFSPQSLFAIASAFTSGAPIRTVARGLWRAIRQEVAWLAESHHPAINRSTGSRTDSTASP